MLALAATCNEEEIELLESGGGLVRNNILIDGNRSGNESSGDGAGEGTTQQEPPDKATETGSGVGIEWTVLRILAGIAVVMAVL